MKKFLTLILTLTMVFSLCACGSKEPAEEQSQVNVESSDTAEVVEPVVADEEIVGMWEDSEGCTFEFTEDNGLKWSNGMGDIWFAEAEYNPWTIEGNILSLETYGEQYKWEIQIENEQITLKFINEGLDYSLPMACVDLVKQQ